MKFDKRIMEIKEERRLAMRTVKMEKIDEKKMMRTIW